METNFNLGSLKIVQVSLMEYFKKALENIDSNLILLREERKVPTNHDAIELLSKSQKTLDMIGLKGISRILLLCEEALREVREVRFDSKKTIEILELASQIVKNSSIYLQKLVNTGFDQPTKFFNEYSRMANLLNKEVFIKDLFYPKLELSSETNEQMQNDLRIGIFINDSSKKNLKTHIEKVTSIIDAKIPEVFKVLDAYGEFYSEQEKNEYQNVCKSLYEAFDFIQKLKLNKNYYILFGIYKLYICILSPIFNNSFNSYISERKQIIKENLNRLSSTVNKLLESIKEMEVGEKTGNLRIEEETIKEILFEMIFAVDKNKELKEMPVYKDLESFFDITFYIEQLSKNSSIEDLNMISEDRVLEIERSFLDLKEDFNLLTYKEKDTPEYSQFIVKCLNNCGELINSTNNVKELSFLIKELNYGFELLRNNEAKLNDIVKKEISLALVLIDYGINNFIKNIVDARFVRDYEKQVQVQVSRLRASYSNNEMELKSLPLPRLDFVSQKADEKKTFSKIFEQLNNDLIKIEETLDYFLKNEGENIEEISSIYKPLVSMRGIFSIIGKPELGKVINKISEPWKEIIDNRNTEFNIEELKESIALVSGLSLLIKAYVEENEVAAEELHNNLMKIFYKNNKEEVVDNDDDLNQSIEVKEVIEEVKPVEEEFSFEISEFDNLEFEEPSEEKLELVDTDISTKEIIDVFSNNSSKSIFTETTNDPDLADVFLMEAEEVLGLMSESILKLEKNINDTEELTNVRRFFHTLKGSGRMVGLEYMGEAGWMTEQTLNKCLSGDIEFTKQIFTIIKEMKVNFENWVQELKTNNQVTVDLVSIKRKFLEVNPALTNHVEINVNSSFDSENTEEEIKPIEQESFGFAFEEKAEVKIEEEIKPVEQESFGFTFEEKAEVKIEEEIKPVEQESFGFTFEEKAEVKIEEEIKPVEEESFSFTFEEKAEVNTEEEIKSVEEESFSFTFEEKAEVNTEEIDFDSNEDSDYLMIDGSKISKSLYEIFNQESLEHITSLKQYVHQDYSEPVMLNEEFMRHAHTLSSISASVNLKKISKIANKLEKISVLTKERKIALSQIQMNVIRHVVDNLDLFKEIDTSEHNAYYESLIEKLKGLLDEVNLDNSDKDSSVKIQAIDSMVEEEKVVQEARSLSEEDMLNLSKEIKSEVHSEVMSEVNLLFKNNKDLLIELLMNKNKEVVSELNTKIAKLEETIEELKENQLQREKLLNKALEVTKNDIRTLASIVKKKYGVAIHKNDELNKEDFQVKLDDSIDKGGEKQNNFNFDKENELVVLSANVDLNDLESKDDVALHSSENYFSSNVVEEKNNSEDNFKFEFNEKENSDIGSLDNQTVDNNSNLITAENELINEFSFEAKEEIEADISSLDNIIDSTNQLELISESDIVLEKELSEDKEVTILNKNLEIEKQELNLSDEDKSIYELLSEHEGINIIFEEKVASVEDEIDDDIFEISKVEAEEMLENINPILERINEAGLSINEGLELKRYLHTLKGSLRMAGANKIGMLAHRLESLIDYAESRKLNFYKLKALLEKEVNKIIFLLKDHKQVLSEAKAAWLDQLVDEKIISSNNIATATTQKIAVANDLNNKDVVKEQKKENKQYIRVLSNVLDTAINDAGEIRLARNSLENTNINNRKSLIELKNSSSKLAKMVKEIEVQAETQIQAQSTKIDENSTNFDPLEFDRFTRLQELTRLMNEAVADIEETVNNLDSNAKVQDNTINEQAIVTNNLLAELMKVRLVNIESVSDRFYKIARNTAKELSKRVSLEIKGEKTEVDKFLLDKIISPIEHILRNSIAHGIEVPEERTLKNKQALGKIVMDISSEGNYTIIKIIDDGAGININKVRQLGISKGLISANEEYSKEDIINLIFNSGFSTADNISQVAGRGVGMDVVKNEILSIGGSIKIQTEKDMGTTFTLIIPMDVATNQSMLCVVRDKLLAIPALLIEEVVSIKEMQLRKSYELNSITLNNIDYPLYYVGHLMGLMDSNIVPEIKSYNSLIRVKYGTESIVLHFDKLITTTEILIKPLGSIYSKISGLLGVTILGDGRQGVVINPIQILEHYQKNIKTIHIGSNREEEIAASSNKITVMVVDDSITVRRASSKILERNNFNVILAKDGEDALEQLQLVKPNIILSDIEMPRMDGFEFVKNVRSMNKFNDIPIIMITSRTADKHQKHAFELGANDFLGKPYKEEDLMFKIELQLAKMKEA